MFRFVALLTLVAQMLQLFACCERCCADGEPPTAAPAVASRCCQHDHGCRREASPPSPEAPPPRDDSHHVCLATHVFYVREGRGNAAQDSGQLKQALAPVAMIRTPCVATAVDLRGSRDVPPPVSAAARRAARGVYLL